MKDTDFEKGESTTNVSLWKLAIKDGQIDAIGGMRSGKIEAYNQLKTAMEAQQNKYDNWFFYSGNIFIALPQGYKPAIDLPETSSSLSDFTGIQGCIITVPLPVWENYLLQIERAQLRVTANHYKFTLVKDETL